MTPLHVTYRKTGELIPYARNARTHSQEQVQRIAASIKEFGFTNPILIDGDNGIIAGHGRLAAAQLLKMDEVPTIELSGMSETQKRAYILADNRLALDAGWDDDLLAIELEELKLDGVDLSLTGFTAEEIDALLSSQEDQTTGAAEEEDDVPEAQEETVSVAGDIWLLGDHRLMCGDSTDATSVAKLMNGEKADLCFTDPPYGMGKEAEGVANDNKNAAELLSFNAQWVPLSFSSLKDTASWMCWGTDQGLLDMYSETLFPMIRSKDVVFKNFIKWKKPNPPGLNSDDRGFHPSGESAIFVMKGRENATSFNINAEDFSPRMQPLLDYMQGEAERLGITPKKVREITGTQMYSHWFSRSQFSIPTREQYEKLRNYFSRSDGFKRDYDSFKRDYDGFKREYDELKREFYEGRAFFDNSAEDSVTDIWEFPIVAGKEREEAGGHATPKPIALCERAIRFACPEKGLVLDLFGGSGSTMIAAQKAGRVCYMMELTPRFCDVIVRRWQQFTGRQAIHAETTRTFGETEAERLS